jgi:hypothetical protein
VGIPDTILQRMKVAESGEAGRTEGIRIAQELTGALRGRVQGVRVTAPLGRYSTVVEVLQALRPSVGPPVGQATGVGGNGPQ